MKFSSSTVFVAAFLLISVGVAEGRAVRRWSYQELMEKSDLVVIASAIANNDIGERSVLLGGEPVIGVETKFAVATVIKGDQKLDAFVLRHYRTENGTNIPRVPNGPGFVSFPIAGRPAATFQHAFLLFLTRETDGRYGPVAGQTDPSLAVKELVPPQQP